MKIVNIIGGLGNQMFQYAFALGLKSKYPNEAIKIDLSHFKGYPLHNGYELERVFGLKLLDVASSVDLMKVSYFVPNYKLSRLVRRVFPHRKSEYIEPRSFTDWSLDINAIKGNCYFEGSWQNFNYFEDIEIDIRNAFSFKDKLQGENLQIANLVESTNSVSIHIRRGDYLLEDEYAGICDVPYYSNAISYIKNNVANPHFFIFSNDIDWCNEHIVPLCDTVTLVSGNSAEKAYVDMQLMSMCKHNIIAHSSFSWWAAWLNGHAGKIVIAPFEWMHRQGLTDKPQMPDWKLMKNI